jgi:hypothetical protein
MGSNISQVNQSGSSHRFNNMMHSIDIDDASNQVAEDIDFENDENEDDDDDEVFAQSMPAQYTVQAPNKYAANNNPMALHQSMNQNMFNRMQQVNRQQPVKHEEVY